MPGDIRSFFGAAALKKPAAEPKADATKSDVAMVDLTDEPAAKPAASPARPAPTPAVHSREPTRAAGYTSREQGQLARELIDASHRDQT